MPNGNNHRLLAALVIGGFSLSQNTGSEEALKRSLLHSSVAALATNLPDLLEPAINPHHRQFFHSMVFGGLVVYAGCKLYRWSPEERWERVARNLLLVGCGSYLLHLLADSFTPRGLPLVGRV